MMRCHFFAVAINMKFMVQFIIKYHFMDVVEQTTQKQTKLRQNSTRRNECTSSSRFNSMFCNNL